MMFILRLIGLLGVPESLRKPVAYIGGALLAVGLLWALWTYLGWREEADDKANREAGAEQERAESITETLDRTEAGNEARDQAQRELDSGRSDELYARCLRTARTRSNCQRFLPERQSADR